MHYCHTLHLLLLVNCNSKNTVLYYDSLESELGGGKVHCAPILMNGGPFPLGLPLLHRLWP